MADKRPIEGESSPPSLKVLCSSAEKLRLSQTTDKPSCSKQLFPDRHTECQVTQSEYGTMLTYEDLTEEVESQAYDAIANPPLDRSYLPPEVADKSSDYILKWRFNIFTARLVNNTTSEQPKWNNIVKEMKSPKTMQKKWCIFFQKPVSPSGTVTHVPAEAILCQDSDRIRAASTETSCFYMLEYTKGQRSIAGLLKLLKSVGVTECLFGVPLFKNAPARKWFKDRTTALSSGTDVSFLGDDKDEECTETIGFQMDQMINFCVETQPKSVEVLMFKYTQEAIDGEPNAMIWHKSTGALTWAKNAFALWKGTRMGEISSMSLDAYINACIKKHEGGNADHVSEILTFQGVDETKWLHALKLWLRGIIKKNVIIFYGPGSTGKSLTCDALMCFLGGSFLTWHRDNQFWLSGAIGSRYCAVDDITSSAWTDIDSKHRRHFDGGLVTVNKKFCEPTTIKFPPLCVTTNCDLRAGSEKWEFLLNRLTWFDFPNSLEGPDGLATIVVTASDFARYFDRHRLTLNIVPDVDEPTDQQE
ncbi:E1 protein [Papillomaviridae sp. Haddock_c145]|nr:E1 protein [Papillomaviridae sp. Haddock_c145]